MDDHRGKMFDQIFYTPGNHDHHLWETAGKASTWTFSTLKNPGVQSLESPWHTTRMFTDPVRSYFLTSLIQRRLNLKQNDYSVGLS